MALLSGATLVVLDRFHPSTFWRKVREHRVTWFYCLGVMPKLMLNTPPSPLDRDHSVRRVICSAIPRVDHSAIEARWGVPWYEAFGMTESGLDVAVELADHDEAVGTGCIGTPMPGREARRGGYGRPARAGGNGGGARAARRRADGRLLPQPGRDRRRVPQRLGCTPATWCAATSGGGSST